MPMELLEGVRSEMYDEPLSRVYGAGQLEAAKQRCVDVIVSHTSLFGPSENLMLLSVPGRTELGGNHTDHNHGHVLAAAVDRDMLVAVSPSCDGTIRLWSVGFPMVELNIDDLSPRPDEAGTPAALVRGVAASLAESGWKIGGFQAVIDSQIPIGSGLSSSAAFEILIASALSHLYNQGRISAKEAAQAGRKAENVWFQKPCGLMDQLACALGGVVAMDFQDAAEPCVESLSFDLGRYNHRLMVVNTGSGHEGMAQEYAALPEDMYAVARFLGGNTLRDVDERLLYANLPQIRAALGDKALLRAMHFFMEDRRAVQEADAIRKGQFFRLLQLMRESGVSSGMFLQNVFLSSDDTVQPLSVALALCAHILQGQGASRVHGGGFAGTIQAIVPSELVGSFVSGMEAVFGAGCCLSLKIRPAGMVRLI